MKKDSKQIGLAEKLGKSFNNGQCVCLQPGKQPNWEMLFLIAELLNVNVKDLIVDNKNEDK